MSDEERERHTSRIRQLIYPLDTHMDLNIGTAFWFASRYKYWYWTRESTTNECFPGGEDLL